MCRNFADRLIEAVHSKGGPAAVALDPVYENLPPELRSSGGSELDAIAEFGRRVIHLIAPIVPVVKINSAYFERYHAKGVDAYYQLVRLAREQGLIVIGDVKRGDVGHTAAMYAHAHLCGTVRAPCSVALTPPVSFIGEGAATDPADAPGAATDQADAPDAITVSGYFGIDGVRPFIDAAKQRGRGVFVLVRTSNPSAAEIQDLPLADGRKVHEAVAAQVAAWAEESVGASGYSCVGAVVATRRAEDAVRLRAAMPRCVFLAPGYGAQGGRAADYQRYFHAGGAGALVAAGRSVIFAYEQERYRSAGGWERAVQAACLDFALDLATIIDQ